MSTYYRESFDYPPIRMFLESGSANSITNNGNVTFTLNQQIQIPNDVVGYVSLQELTIANTNYNINIYNNMCIHLYLLIMLEIYLHILLLLEIIL